MRRLRYAVPSVLAVLLCVVVLVPGRGKPTRRATPPAGETSGRSVTPGAAELLFPANLPRVVLPLPPQRRLSGGQLAAPRHEEISRIENLQAEVDQILLTEVAPLKNERELLAFLDKLVERAKSRRAIPVTIAAPGFSAIRMLELGEERQRAIEAAFSARLDELRRSFDN